MLLELTLATSIPDFQASHEPALVEALTAVDATNGNETWSHQENQRKTILVPSEIQTWQSDIIYKYLF